MTSFRMTNPTRGWRRRAQAVLVAGGIALIGGCGGSEKAGSGDSTARPSGGGATNSLLVIGYDREPDTMNRYATHILEDIESCVVEGLVANDEQLNAVPVLAAEIPTVENGGVTVRPDGGMDVTWKLRPNVT